MASKIDGLKGKILVVDDEEGMRVALTDVLRRDGWSVEAVDRPDLALDRIKASEDYDLLMTDYRMNEMTGLDLARQVRSLRPNLPIVMMTAYGSVEDAVAAMKEGVDDYLLKPFSFETVTKVVGDVVKAERPAPEATRARRSSSKRGCEAGRIIGDDVAWKNSLHVADHVADSSATILLTGESGTGKEVLARYIHERSGRSGPYVAINCAALPEGVLESELFGHEKGAFTGAVLARKGRFEQADGGTILLDEISEIPLALQAKLLRVLQEREINPIGSDATVKLDIRVIATTNRDLEAYVEEGHFRQDLYYRLNVIAIDLPPLRERPGDIQRLAEYFVERYRRPNRPAARLSAEAKDFLMRHAWMGNVRELENVMERACLLARSEEIQTADLHLDARSPLSSTDFSSAPAGRARDPHMAFPAGQTLDEMERRMILHTLDTHQGNRTRTARALGVSVRTIRNKLHQYGVTESAASSA